MRTTTTMRRMAAEPTDATITTGKLLLVGFVGDSEGKSLEFP